MQANTPDDSSERWAFSTLEQTAAWCKFRNKQHVSCTVDVLGEDIMKNEGVEDAYERYLECVREIQRSGLNATLSVKLTSIGALFDKPACLTRLFGIFEESRKLGVSVEIDMEGKPLVEFTVNCAVQCADAGYEVTLALQAYLDRTIEDIKTMADHGIKVRLVKGAYRGDTTDFEDIRGRFKALAAVILDCKLKLCIGTHDEEIVEWAKSELHLGKDAIDFGFLKGLADQAKVDLVGQGWAVSEYVPYGDNTAAYVVRRKNYLKQMQKAGQRPIQ